MKRFSRFVLLSLAVGSAFGLGTLARSDSSVDRADLAQFRAALDAVSAGHAADAQSSLERSAAPLSETNANVLAYLQERDGQNARAARTLQSIANPSPMSRLWMQSLGVPTGAPVNSPVVAPSDGRADNRARLVNNDARIAKLEQLIFRLINQERVARNLNELKWDDDLADVGRAHAAEMRDKNYFAHESPTPGLRNPLDRYVEGTGRTPRLIAENIYRAWGNHSFLNDADLRVAHKALMDSPGHRQNILLGSANSVGVGLVANSSGDIWLDEMFSKP